MMPLQDRAVILDHVRMIERLADVFLYGAVDGAVAFELAAGLHVDGRLIGHQV